MNYLKKLIIFCAIYSSVQVFSHFHIENKDELKAVIIESSLLKKLNIESLYTDPVSKLAYTVINNFEAQQISHEVHKEGKCGGFEMLSNSHNLSTASIEELFSSLKNRENTELFSSRHKKIIKKTERSLELLELLSKENLEKYVEWLSSFKNRYYKDSNANKHIDPVIKKIQNWIDSSSLNAQVERINHSSIKQDSIRLRIDGSLNPDAIVVLGGHLDSITSSFWGGPVTEAPGADDNASGSACLLEVARVILENSVENEKTLEFFWYAGEEGGLIGSAEIAKDYKNTNKNVEAVLQLDMTSFPGSGVHTIGSMNDFTSKWLRDFLVEINIEYELGITIEDDQCGYGCSDHASWYRQGFDTVMPFESTFDQSNKKIHTKNDLINTQTNWEHSLNFAKIALIFTEELANN